MPRERSQIRRSLETKGFVLRDGDHEYYSFYLNSKKTSIRTKLSRGAAYKDYSDQLLGDIAHQLSLTRQELLEFIDCPMSEKEYARLLGIRKNIH